MILPVFLFTSMSAIAAAGVVAIQRPEVEPRPLKAAAVRVRAEAEAAARYDLRIARAWRQHGPAASSQPLATSSRTAATPRFQSCSDAGTRGITSIAYADSSTICSVEKAGPRSIGDRNGAVMKSLGAVFARPCDSESGRRRRC